MSTPASGPLVGFYVHHHGLGHLTRARTILAHLDSRAALLSSVDLSRVPDGEAEKVPLPFDTDVPPVDPTGAPPLRGLHYAPLGGDGLRERAAGISAWVRENRPALLVVDVSAEVSVLGRLLGLPVVTVRQHGLRTDDAHLLAYGVSHSLLAPYPEELEEPSVPAWVARRTFYAGGFCRDDARIGVAAADPDRARTVCVLVGAGGSSLGYAAVARAAEACPGWRWVVLGGLPGARRPVPNLEHHPWADDVFSHLLRSDVVVASGSHNSVMETSAARRPLVCIPQDRPFDEQVSKGRALERLGAAVVRDEWPAASRWPALLSEALALGSNNLSRLVDGGGARRAAGFLDALARRASGA